MTLNLADWLPGLLGPLELQVNGQRFDGPPRIVWNYTGLALSIVDDPNYVDPETGAQVGRRVFNFSGGSGAAPEGSGFAYVADGAWTTTPANIRYTGGKLQSSTNIQLKVGTRLGDVAAATLSADRTWTLPDASGTVCLLGATQTLTAKTIDTDVNTLTSAGGADGDILVRSGTKYVRMAKGANDTRFGVDGEGNLGYFPAADGCDEPKTIHQTIVAWKDAECTEEPGAPDVEVTSWRTQFSVGALAVATLYAFPELPAAAEDTVDVYLAEVTLFAKDDTGTVPIVAKSSFKFEIADDGTLNPLESLPEFYSDVGRPTLDWSYETNYPKIVCAETGESWDGVPVDFRLVVRLTCAKGFVAAAGGED